VAAVAEQQGRFFCGVRHGEAVDRREVTLGQGNDKLVEITAGLEDGEVVVLNPRAAIGEEPAADGEASTAAAGSSPRRGGSRAAPPAGQDS